VIQTEKVTIYFAGDTGNGIHFEQASSLFPTIDYCLLPVGAYKPQWLMSPQHMSPNNAVEAFNQLNGKIFIPMHYGTYDLSDEPLGEPLRILNSLKNEHKINGELKVLKIGEVNFLH
jgi:L-ascorbate metabolism protein UlaG (beta-lactamase superfamily)